jgi:hypothetical protein
MKLSWLAAASLRGGRGGWALRLCAFAFSGGQVAFVISSCLRAFVFLHGRAGGKSEIRNSKSAMGGWAEIRNPKSEIRNGRAVGIS